MPDPLAMFTSWIDRIAWEPLLLVAFFLGLAPFFPEPHLWEKIKMLVSGQLTRPLDIFDLLMHATPVLLVLIKLWRQIGTGMTS